MGLLMRKRKKVEKPVTFKKGVGGNVDQANSVAKEMWCPSADIHGMGKYLCIGDYIALYCEETEGYVYSEQSSTINNGLHMYIQQDRDRPRNIPNLQVVLFQVSIQNRYKLNKKLRKLQAYQEQQDAQSLLVKTDVKLKTSAEAENKDNEAEQKRLFQKKVRYGEIIQLRHVFTGKYVHSSTTQTSQKDRNNMRISLHDFNAKNAQFKILPRYKVKSEGEFVQLYDQVMLESIKSVGHFLHASEPFQIDHFNFGCELNLGVERSSFTLVGSFRDYPNQSQLLRGGSVVRLFHKELEAYLIAEGLFNDTQSETAADENAPNTTNITECIHFRIRAFDPYNPKTISPSTSGVTYWQIESESSIVDGDVIKWEQQIRLRHMTTRKYLCLDNNLEINLITDNSDPRTVFRFHSVIKELDDIKFESYTRIEHMLTGCWLHALKDQTFDRRIIKDETGKDSSQHIETDTAKKRRTFTSTASMYADAYTLQHVPLEDVYNFNYIAGIVPFLVNLIKDLNELPTLSSRRTHSIVMALHDINVFLLENGLPIKKRQKLLRNLKVIDLLVELVQCPLRVGEEQIHRIRIYKEAYDVLHAYMIGKSGKNAVYMAKYIDFFQTQLTQKGGIGINVAQMIVELMRDKRKIVDRITSKHIDRFIKLLGETKNFRFLNLLEVLCVCDGVAIPNNQSFIAEEWLRQNRGYKYYTARGQNINKEPNVMFMSTTNKESWIPIHQLDCEFCDMSDELSVGEDNATFTFLLHQLDLIKALCLGRNDFAVHVITREKAIMPWEDAHLCLTSTQLSDQFRAKICEVIIAAFVEVGSNYSVLDQPELCFVFEYVGTKDDENEESQDGQNSFAPESSQGIKDLATLFPVMRDFIIEFMEKNTQMVASDVGRNLLIEQVLCLLKHLVRFGYFSDLEEINKIIQPLIDIIDGSTDVPFKKNKAKGYSRESQKIVNRYKSEERYDPNIQTGAVVNAKYQGLQVLDFLLTFQRNLRLKTMVEKFKLVDFEEKRNKSLSMTPLMYANYNPRDTKKKSRKQQKKVLRELREMFDASDILEKEHCTKILMDISEYGYDKMVTKALDILNKAYSSQSDMFKLAERTQLLLTSESVAIHCDVKRELPVLQRFVRQKANDSQIEIMCNILDEFIRLCKLDKGNAEPHVVNQNILVSHGILSVIQEVLQQDIDPKLEEEYSGMKLVLSKTLKLVQVLAKNNKDVQESICYHLDVLLDVNLVPSDLAAALKELFVANQTTCLKITDTQIKKIVLLACQYQAESPEYLDLLYTLVKVEGLDVTIKRNQSLVMKYIMQNYNQSAFILEKPKNEREDILTNASAQRGNLAYYVKFVDLLSVCAEGENKFIESLCQTMLPIEELLWIMNHTDIDNIVKAPFVKFMEEVYLQFRGDIIESGAADLQHNKNMWEFFDEMTRCMGRAVSGIEDCKGNIRSPMKQKPDKRNTKEETSVHKLHCNIFYLVDSVLPFIKTYFSRVYQADEELYPDEIDTTNAIALSVANLCETVSPLLSNPIHMKSVVSVVTVLIPLSAEPKSLFKKVLQKIFNSFNVTDTRDDVTKGNMIYYTKEIQLNEKFHTFARNCNIINKGYNTVKSQIGYKSKREYTELGLSDEMPLGEEFQSLVKCFINQREKKPSKKFNLASKLLHQLQISSALFKKSSGEAIEYDNLDIKCLQILRAFIHNEERKLPEDIDAIAGETSVKKQLEHVKEVQNAINEHDFVRKVLPHIARRNDNIVREVLGIISGMLFNANRDIQKCMLQYFLSTREELFFMALRERMLVASNSIKEKRSLLAQHKEKVTETSLQLADGDDSISLIVLKILQMIQVFDAQLKKERMYGWALVGHPQPPDSGKKKSKTSKKKGFDGEEKVLQNGKPGYIDIITVSVQGEDATADNALSDMMEYNDDGYIELVLELLARICDGQNADLQDYLREQPDNVKSFNIVAETTQFLNVVYSSVTEKTIDLLIKVFSSLNEFCAGNQENRVVLYGNKIVDYMNFIFRSSDIGDCPPDKVLALRHAMGCVILSMIEENGPEKSEVAKEVKDTIDKQALLRCMKNCYEVCLSEHINLADIVKIDDESVRMKGSAKNLAGVGGGFVQGILGRKKDPNRDSVTDTGYLFYLIWARMVDIDPGIHKKVELTPEHEKAIEFYKKNCLSIEIIKDDVLQKVNFRAGNKSLLREEVKENLKWNVDRTSPSNKIRDLMEWLKDILHDISYQRKILQKPISKMFTNLWLIWNFGAVFLSVAINLLMLYTWNAKASLEDYQKQNNQTVNWNLIADPNPEIKGIDKNVYDVTMYALMGTHNFFSLMMFISYMLLNHPRLPSLTEIVAPFRLLCDKKDNDEDKTDKTDNHESKLDAKLFSFKTIYFMVFLAFSALGTIYNGYFFSFHLLNIVINNQLLRGVIRSVTQNGLSLFWVAVLGLIVIYIYALIGFSLLRAFFDPDNYLYCHTLFQCTITVIRYGLIGDMFDAVAQGGDHHQDFSSFWPLVLYHVSFFIFITTIGLNIIFGIIVDTFSELRDLKWRAESDMRECCFICGRNSYDFEHTGKGFQNHVQNEHSLWAYIFFFIHLDNVKQCDYNALELYVASLWKKEDYEFFPLNRAMCLASADLDINESKIEDVLSKVTLIHKKQQEEEMEKKRRKEKLRQKRWHERHRAFVFDPSLRKSDGSVLAPKKVTLSSSDPLDTPEMTLKETTEDADSRSLTSDIESVTSYDETPRHTPKQRRRTSSVTFEDRWDESTKL